MKAYRGESYQERVGRAAEAKQKALDALKARPAVDEATLAARRDAAFARETAQAAKRAAGWPSARRPRRTRRPEPTRRRSGPKRMKAAGSPPMKNARRCATRATPPGRAANKDG